MPRSRPQRRQLGSPARRAPAPRRPARAVQRRGRRHHDHPGASKVTTSQSATNPLMPTYPPPVTTFVRGEGAWLWDDDGKRYLDLLSGLAVTSLGHAHQARSEEHTSELQSLMRISYAVF